MTWGSLLALITVGLTGAGATAATAAPGDSVRSGSGAARQVASIALSPQAVSLPASGSAHTINVSLALADSAGSPITSGSLATPVTLHVYGPSGGVLRATTPTLRTAARSVSFSYSGAAVANTIIVNAVSGHAFAQMAFHPPQPNTSTGGPAVTFPMSNASRNIAKGFTFRVSVGRGPSHRVEMDTGSHGIVVPASALGPGAVGPGPAAQITYTSDGKIFRGNYYLAPITLQAGGVSATTVPIRVLAVKSSACAPGFPQCVADRIAGLGMLGVGFDRGAASQTPPELANAFLALQSITTGSMHPGYIIARNGVTLGLNLANTAGFDSVALTAGGSGPGDWNTEPGCFAFPQIGGYSQQCGTVLMDTGIPSAIFGLPSAQRPPSIATSIPDGTAVAISVGQPASPVLSYSFAAGDGGAMTPTSLRWAAGTAPFINTGRRVISSDDYLYDAGAGAVGFRAH